MNAISTKLLCLPLFFLVALHGGLPAQAPTDSIDPFVLSRSNSNWGTSNPCMQMVALDIDGDFHQDVVALDSNGTLHLLRAVDSYTSFTVLTTVPAISGAVDSIAVLPGVGPNQDGLVIRTSTGIHTVISDGAGSFDLTLLVGGDWITATMLHVVDFGVDKMVCGLKSDGTTILSHTRIGGAWSVGPNFLASGTVKAIEGNYDWDDDGGREVVAITDQGATDDVEAFELTGGVSSSSVSLNGPVEGFAPVQSAGKRDQYAVAVDTLTGLQIALVDSGGVSNAAPMLFDLNGTGVLVEPAMLGLASGDVDRDGNDDVLIGHSNSLETLVVYNVPDESSAEFDTANDAKLISLQQSGSLMPSGCTPSFADYDRDGFADALTILEDGTVILQQGMDLYDVNDPSGGGSGTTAGDFLNAISDFEEAVSPGGDGQLHVVLTLLPDYADAYDFVEVNVWEQAGQGADLPTASEVQIYYRIRREELPPHNVVSLDQWFTIDTAGLFPGTNVWNILGTDYYYFVKFRFVNLADGEITEASTAFFFGVGVDETNATGTGSPVAYLQSLATASTVTNDEGELKDGDGPPEPELGEKTTVGGFVVQNVLPPTVLPHPVSGSTQVAIPVMKTWNPQTYPTGGS